ncbi:MAG: transporter [Gemmatimonadota bacterium]|nr:transporter [Gemmatimonadota bacterium]
MTSFPRTTNMCMEFLHQKLTPHVIPLLIVALSVLMPQMASAGAWTLGKGQVWSKITYMSLSTNEHYDNDGNVGEIPARYKSQQLYFDVYYGLNDRIDVGVKIPYISNEFVDVSPEHPFYGAPDKKDSGLGDVRGVAKINLVNSADLVGTLKLGFKAPMGEYREVPEALSITGGQWDFEVVAQLGRSFWPVPVYGNVDLGYRLRGEYTDPNPSDAGGVDRTYTPGAEFVFNAEAGYSPMDKLLVALKYESIIGSEYDTINNPPAGSKVETLNQSVAYLAPTVLVGLHPSVSLEAQARMTVSGSRYFAGSTYGVGLSFTADLIEQLVRQGTP